MGKLKNCEFGFPFWFSKIICKREKETAMRIIISPAKKMNRNTDLLPCESMPVFLEETEKIMKWLRALSYSQAKALWRCNDNIAGENFKRLQDMDLNKNLTPAIISYEGIQYQYMAPAVFERRMLDYVQSHLRILSGFYGVLKPMDGVVPYRLEMQAKTAVNNTSGLYQFWGSRLYEEVMDESRTVINLASREYSRCIEQFVRPEDIFITIIFGELSGNKVIQKGTYAKMARGEMVRFMAENQIREPAELQKFDRLNYVFRPELSSEREYVFVHSTDGL